MCGGPVPDHGQLVLCKLVNSSLAGWSTDVDPVFGAVQPHGGFLPVCVEGLLHRLAGAGDPLPGFCQLSVFGKLAQFFGKLSGFREFRLLRWLVSGSSGCSALLGTISSLALPEVISVVSLASS